MQVIEAGANALVAGSAVFGSKDYAEAIAGIKASKAPAKEPVHGLIVTFATRGWSEAACAAQQHASVISRWKDKCVAALRLSQQRRWAEQWTG